MGLPVLVILRSTSIHGHLKFSREEKKQKNHVPTEAIAWVMGVEVHTEVTLVLSSHEPPSHIEAYAGAKAFCLEISD